MSAAKYSGHLHRLIWTFLCPDSNKGCKSNLLSSKISTVMRPSTRKGLDRRNETAGWEENNYTMQIAPQMAPRTMRNTGMLRGSDCGMVNEWVRYDDGKPATLIFWERQQVIRSEKRSNLKWVCGLWMNDFDTLTWNKVGLCISELMPKLWSTPSLL